MRYQLSILIKFVENRVESQEVVGHQQLNTILFPWTQSLPMKKSLEPLEGVEGVEGAEDVVKLVLQDQLEEVEGM